MEDVAPSAGAIGCCGEDVLEELEAAGEGLLVGRDDADALLEEAGVCVCDILVRCVVDEDDLAGRLNKVVLKLWEGESGFRVALELGFPVGEGLVVGVVDGFLGGREPDEREVVGRRGRLGEACCQAGQLVEEDFSYAAGAYRTVSIKASNMALVADEIKSVACCTHTDDGNEDLTRRRHGGYSVNWVCGASVKKGQALKKLDESIQHSMSLRLLGGRLTSLDVGFGWRGSRR